MAILWLKVIVCHESDQDLSEIGAVILYSDPNISEADELGSLEVEPGAWKT